MAGGICYKQGADAEDDCILYELLVYAEWKQEPEISKLPKVGDNVVLTSQRSSYIDIWKYFRSPSPADKVLRLFLNQLPWKLAVGENGKVVAVLQDVLLEIRASRDEYSSVVGKAVVSRDPAPQWRKMLWSPDCSMLAVAHSTGDISFYSLLGSNIFSIRPGFLTQEKVVHPLASILFTKTRVKSLKWSYEFVVVDYRGNLYSYLVSQTDGFMENHSFSFASYYHNGVTAVSYHPSHNLLFVSGLTGLLLNDSVKEQGSSVGLSTWRILNNYPYYQLMSPNDDEQAKWQMQHSLWNWLPGFRGRSEQDPIFKMQVSPKGTLVVCLHISGSISVWHLPSLKIYRFWRLYDQPNFDVQNPQLLHLSNKSRYRFNTKFDDTDFHPVDANWWSEKAVIIARYSGAVSVCSVRSLDNLLGDSPEFLAGQPQISELCSERGFLGLECEMFVSSKRIPDDDQSVLPDSESSDEEEDVSLLRRSSNMIQSAVYMITDIERFQPKRKKPKLLHKTYRLLGLKSTTPEELYSRKIDNEEYGEALALARAYNLDCDLVYQRQWRNSPVSIATIHDYLSKITKRSWVLKECVERVPETFGAARELLEFGLRGINLETIVSVGEGTDGGHFIHHHPDLDYEDDETQIQKSEEREKKLLSKINAATLTSDQKDLLRFRILLLHYLDMLRTYEIILGGPHMADTLYDYTFYERFRSTPLIVSVIDFARDANCQAVQHMFTYHGSVVLPHWLPILSSFPETMNPEKYQNLLPECGVEGGVVLLEQSQLRKDECFEQDDFRHALDAVDCDGSSFLYEEEPDLQQFYCPLESLTTELITKWYQFQVCQIESRSGIVDYALNLVRLGKERNVSGLDELYYQLKTLDSLIYEVNILSLSLSSLKNLSFMEQTKLLMSKTSGETFVSDIKQILLPFLDQCEKQSAGTKLKLLRDYLVDISSNDLKLPKELFEYLHSEPNSVIIQDVEDITNIGFDCVYACSDPDQLETAERIVEYISKQPIGIQSPGFTYFQDKLHEIQRDIAAAKILHRNEISKAVSYIRDIKENSTIVKPLLNKLARTVAKRTPPPKKQEWEHLLSDILMLQQKAFKCISVRECYEIYAETLLSSGVKANIQAAASILDCRKSSVPAKWVSFDHSVDLVLRVAREYFDSAGDLLDPAMELAKLCLHVILDDHPDIQEHLDLISSLQVLSEFGIQMLPLQVRQCEERMHLIEACLQKKPLAYRSWKTLLQLGNKLRISGHNTREREGRILTLMAEKAFEAEDYDYCAEICKTIVDNNYGIGWSIVKRLGLSTEFSNVQLRCEFLSFAVLHCDPDLLDILLTDRCWLEAQVLHQQVSSQVTDESIDLTSGDEEEFSDALTSPMTPKREFPPVSSIVNVMEGSREVTKRTYQLLKHVGDKNFWKDAISGWLPGSVHNFDSPEEEEFEEPLLRQSVPAFYLSSCPDCRPGALDPRYNHFSVPDTAAVNPALALCRTLLRVTLLEEAAGAETNGKDVTDVMLQLARHLLPEDSALGLSHLLLVSDITRITNCFDNLPATPVSLQLASYLCAIKGYCLVYGIPKDRAAAMDVFLYSPSELVSHMVHLIHNSNAQGAWADLLIYYQKMLSDFLQGQQLNDVGCGIDLKRFAVDEQYRQDSILGLPMTVDTKRFQLAVSLGSQHGIPLSQIAAIHASALLLNTEEITIAEQTKRLNDPQLLNFLRKDPEVVCERFKNYVYPSIGGTQHNFLLLYYTTLHAVAENTTFYGLLPKDHLRLLKKVKATSPVIDYKKLVEAPDKFLDAVRPALRKESVGLLVKLLKSLPSALKCDLQPGAIYSAWAAIEFFQVSKGAYALGPRLWIDQYRTCSHYFTKMGAQHVLNFAREICFSEKSLDIIAIDCRISMLYLAKEHCDERKKENQGKEWSDAAATIKHWISHLDTINSAQMDELNGNLTPELQLLLRQLDLSRGEAGLIRQLFKFSVCSSLPLKTLQIIVKLFPPPPSPLEDLLENLLKEALSGLRNGPAPESLALLPAVLRRLQEVADEGTCSLANLWDSLEPVCADTELPPRLRIQAIQFLQKFYLQSQQTPVSQKQKTLLMYHIQAVLSLAWEQNNMSVSELDLATEESELLLFLRLLGNAETWKQLMLIKSLLENWPTFQAPVSSNKSSDPWMLLLFKILHYKLEHLDSVVSTVEDICRKRKFSEESLQQLVSQTQESVKLSLILTVCLSSIHTSLYNRATCLIKHHLNMGEVTVCPRVLTLMLRAGLTPDLVATPLYQQLEQHLLSRVDPQLPPVFAIAAQLEDAGHTGEARALTQKANQHSGNQRGSFLVKLARRTWAQKE